MRQQLACASRREVLLRVGRFCTVALPEQRSRQEEVFEFGLPGAIATNQLRRAKRRCGTFSVVRSGCERSFGAAAALICL
jgi:hypothetical protein